MNILITHFYSRRNNGDAAILYSQLREMRKRSPNAQLTIATMDDLSEYPTFEGVPQVPALFSTALDRHRSRWANLFHIVRSFAGSWLWAITHRLTGHGLSLFMYRSEGTFLASLADADIVVPVGGGYLKANKGGMAGMMDLWLVLQPIYLAHLLGKPVIMYSQSIGPFETKPQFYFAARVLKKCRQINLRENKSFKLLRAIGVPERVLQLTADAAFLLEKREFVNCLPPTVRERLNDVGRPLVGITARAWLKEQGQTLYEEQFAQAIDTIIETHGATVVLIPQVVAADLGDDDRTIQNRIYSKLQHKDRVVNIEDELSFKELKALYGQLDYLIGTRFHSVIFSLTEHVPAIAIEYEHKTSGIMFDLGLEKWVVPIDQVSALQLTTLFNELARERSGYLSHLKSVLPVYIKRAHQANDLIAAMANE
ncbi:MAG TPA: polysaccharide pyruvyl transferase family protein [Bacillota bacterium]|nr:polysaccharide pyruvyl transferase family protein [Bacillota bacterium]